MEPSCVRRKLPWEAVRVLFELCEDCIHGFGVTHILLVPLVIVQHHQHLQQQQGFRLEAVGQLT